MIYMVDHVFADPSSEPAWHAWYAEYLKQLVAVPGIHTAQRFKAIGTSPSRYLAMYSIDSADVYASAAYRRMGGGGSRSSQFHPAYALWTRNLFDGASRAPLVDRGERILVWDSLEPVSGGRMPPQTVCVKAVGLHMTTPYRAFAVLGHDATPEDYDIGGAFLYEPFSSPLVAEQSDRE